MIAFWQQRKKFRIKFAKKNTKFSLRLHYNGDESYLYLNKTEIFQFKAHDASVSKDFPNNEMSEISLNGTAYDFSVDHSANKEKLSLICMIIYDKE